MLIDACAHAIAIHLQMGIGFADDYQPRRIAIAVDIGRERIDQLDVALVWRNAANHQHVARAIVELVKQSEIGLRINQLLDSMERRQHGASGDWHAVFDQLAQVVA